MLPPEEETRRVNAVERDLEREFPDVPADQIESLVAGIWAEFAAARIRDFVPVLVRTAARARLRETSSPGVPRASRSGPSPAQDGLDMDGGERADRLEVTIDLRESRIQVVGTIRQRDEALLHDALVEALLRRPETVTLAMSACNGYGPSLFGLLLRGAKLARAVGASLIVDGTEALREDVHRRHLQQWINVRSPLA